MEQEDPQKIHTPCTAKKQDTFGWLYVLVTVMLLLEFFWEVTFHQNSLTWFSLLMVFVDLVWILILSISLLKNLFMKRWLRSTSIATAAILATLLWILIWKIDPDWIHLVVCKSHYQKEVAQLKVTGGEPRLKKWFWKEISGFPAGATFVTLVYDDSDQITWPYERRSNAWKMRANEIKLFYPSSSEEHVTIQHLEGHYYLLIENY